MGSMSPKVSIKTIQNTTHCVRCTTQVGWLCIYLLSAKLGIKEQWDKLNPCH